MPGRRLTRQNSKDIETQTSLTWLNTDDIRSGALKEPAFENKNSRYVSRVTQDIQTEKKASCKRRLRWLSL